MNDLLETTPTPSLEPCNIFVAGGIWVGAEAVAFHASAPLRFRDPTEFLQQITESENSVCDRIGKTLRRTNFRWLRLWVENGRRTCGQLNWQIRR